MRSQLKELRDQSEDPSLVPTAGDDRNKKGKKEELEERAKTIQRKIEDISAKAKKELSKRSDDAMKVIYKDVMEASQTYAATHDLDLVLHYNGTITEEESLSGPVIARKFNTGGLVPVYSKENMDVSLDIVALLNQKKHKN